MTSKVLTEWLFANIVEHEPSILAKIYKGGHAETAEWQRLLGFQIRRLYRLNLSRLLERLLQLQQLVLPLEVSSVLLELASVEFSALHLDTLWENENERLAVDQKPPL